jgi:uncharacterized protein (TIGR03083 family)
MSAHAAAYQAIKDRVTALTAGLDGATAERLAPATPAWRVKDVLAHLVGVNADVLAGNIDGAGTDPWTAVQVDARRDRTVSELLAEWDEVAPPLIEIFPAIPDGPRGQLIFDAVTHEHDLRGALGQPGMQDSDAIAIGFAWAVDVLALIRDGGGHGAFCLRTEHGDHVAGSGEPITTVAAPRFELFRALEGRRSQAQIDAFEWSGEIGDRSLSFFPPRPTDLVE